MKLTEKMKNILFDADLEKNEINNVPFRTACGLECRELIPSDWCIAKGCSTTTTGGTFPMYSGIKLTKLGIETAFSVKKSK